jgi:iron complex outermembrane receptor protein
MKKWIVWFGILVFAPQLVSAQFSLQGIVINADGEALAGANVLLGTQGNVTNYQGEFEFANLRPGEYQLKVSYVGYKPYQEAITVNSSRTDLRIILTEDGLLPEAVVTGATRATEITPMAYNTVTDEELEKQNLGQDIPYLLNFTPSVVVTSDAGAGVGYTGIRVRGSDATRVNVTINGIPLNDAESHGAFWVNLPDLASSVDNIQLQRGVGTSTNGAGAFGASLNIQTDGLQPQAYAEANLAAGSYNTQKYTVRAGTGLLNNHFAVDARLSKISSDGYIDRAFSDMKSFFVSGGYYGKKTLLKANVFSGREQTYQSWYGTPEAVAKQDSAGIQAFIGRNSSFLPEGDSVKLMNDGRTYNFYTYDNETDNYQQDHYQLIFGHELTNELQLNLAGHYTYGRGYYEQFIAEDPFEDEDELVFYNLPEPVIGGERITSSDIIRRRWLNNHFYGFTYSAVYQTANNLNLTLGGAGNRYLGDHFGEVIRGQFVAENNLGQRFYDNEAIKNDFNTYIKGNIPLNDALSLYADMQYRYVEYNYGGLDIGNVPIFGEHDFHFFNPKLGVNYVLGNGERLYFSYAKGSREPTRGDFVDAPLGQLPKAEKLHDFELGAELRPLPEMLVSLNSYYMKYTDQLVLTGELNDVGNANRVNVPNSYRLGLEAQVAVQPIPEISLQANATLSRNRISSFTEPLYFSSDAGIDSVQTLRYTDSPISFSPSLIAGGILSGRPLPGLEISLLPKYVSRQYLDNTGSESRSIDPYFLTDFRVNYSLQPGWIKEIQLNLLINNLFSKLYESNGYTFAYGYNGEVIRENYLYPQAPRNFLVGANFKF